MDDTTLEAFRTRTKARAAQDRAALKQLREAVDEAERASQVFIAAWKRKPVG